VTKLPDKGEELDLGRGARGGRSGLPFNAYTSWRSRAVPPHWNTRPVQIRPYDSSTECPFARCMAQRVSDALRSRVGPEGICSSLSRARTPRVPFSSPAAGAAEGADGSPKSWAGAISRELRRGALVLVPPPVPPLAAPPGPLGAALRSRGRSYHPARSC